MYILTWHVYGEFSSLDNFIIVVFLAVGFHSHIFKGETRWKERLTCFLKRRVIHESGTKFRWNKRATNECTKIKPKLMDTKMLRIKIAFLCFAPVDGATCLSECNKMRVACSGIINIKLTGRRKLTLRKNRP